MCHSILRLCPICKSNIRHLQKCTVGTRLSSDFKYTNLTAEVCAATGALLSVQFQSGTCSDCIRHAKADAKAAEAANASMEEWHRDLDTLTSRTIKQGRVSPLRPLPRTRSRRNTQDKDGGRKALLQLWYEDAKTKSLKTLVGPLSPGKDSSRAPQQSFPQVVHGV